MFWLIEFFGVAVTLLLFFIRFACSLYDGLREELKTVATGRGGKSGGS
jgi:hypothetical protein